MSNSLKHTLLSLLLFFACFGGQELRAMPAQTAPLSGVQQDEGIAQGKLHSWPAALPELERLITTQASPSPPLKQAPGAGAVAPEIEHWLQQGIARQIANASLRPAGLSGTRIIFPFHYFW